MIGRSRQAWRMDLQVCRQANRSAAEGGSDSSSLQPWHLVADIVFAEEKLAAEEAITHRSDLMTLSKTPRSRQGTRHCFVSLFRPLRLPRVNRDEARKMHLKCT